MENQAQHLLLTLEGFVYLFLITDTYITILQRKRIQPSLTKNSDSLENSIAERVNGILKDEWIKDFEIKDRDQEKILIDKVMKIYNEKRPHSSQLGKYFHEQLN